MRIEELMTSNPLTARADETAADAARIMRDHDLGSLPVVDGDRLAGFVTDRDIIVRCVARDDDCTKTRVREIMSPEVHCCTTGQSPEEAMELMSTRQIHRLPVVDDQQRLVGIVNLGRLAESGVDSRKVCETITAVRQPTGAA